LKLWFKFSTTSMIPEPQLRAVVERPLVTINSMSALKKPTCDCRHHAALDLYWLIDLPDPRWGTPVLSRVQRLHCHSSSTIAILLGSLIKVSVRIAHVFLR